MDKKEFDKQVLEESKTSNKLSKDVMDAGNYTAKSFDAGRILDWDDGVGNDKPTRENQDEYKQLKQNRATYGEMNLAVYIADDTKEELIIILDPDKQYEKLLIKRLPKHASAANKKMLIDHWCVQYNAHMVHNDQGTLDSRNKENYARMKTHITEK